LWQLLLLLRNPKGNVQLTCQECFELIAYDADLLAAGANLADLKEVVRRHLVLCSSCNTQFNEWLEKMEAPGIHHPPG
jgi:hypothetical protein